MTVPVSLARHIVLFAVLIVCCLSGISHASADPPMVVKAAPDHGDVDVDPGLKEIRIEFDQDMSPDGYSVCGGGPTFPKTTGKPRWSGSRIFVLPVALEPGHEYTLSINCPSATNFRSMDRVSAEPYPITFRTGSGKSKADKKSLAPEMNRAAIRELRRLIADEYSYVDVHKADWDKLFKKSEADLAGAKTETAFARIAARVLAHAGDVHITVKAGAATFPTATRKVSPNFNLATVQRAVPKWRQHGDSVYTGQFDDGTTYLLIGTWQATDKSLRDAIDAALNEVIDAPRLIIDVRPNGGGDERLAQRVASRFVRERKVYSRHVYRDKREKGGFSEPMTRVIGPDKKAKRFTGRVAVLMGPANMSSCESFLMMMKQAPKCRTFGDESFGSSGNPQPHDLPNGVVVLLPSWKDILPDGSELEGKGVAPDESVKTSRESLAKRDAVLDAALAWLRGKA